MARDPGSQICVLVSQLSYGGAERQTTVFLEHLAHVHGVRPLVYCMSPQLKPFGDRVRAAGCELIHWRRSGSYEVPRILHIRSVLKRRDIRLVHAVHYQSVAYGFLATLGREHRVAFIPSIRSTVYDPTLVKRVFYRWMLPRCRLILANSQTGAAWVRQFYGVKDGLVRVVPNGIDPGVLEETAPREAVRRGLGIPPQAPLLAFVGKPKSHKDIPLLFRIYRRVRERRPDAHLLLMGWGLTEEWLGRSGHAPLDNVHALGSRDDIYDLLASADVLVLTSPTEGFPNAVLEAMALGVPPVTTKVGECPILIDDGQDGFLFDHGDDETGARHVLALLEDPARRVAMGARARSKVRERYGTGVMAEATLKAYEDALGAPRATW